MRGWLTYQDCVEHVLHLAGEDRSERCQSFARMAVDGAIKQLSGDVNWNYYRRSRRLSVYAPYTTGTIEYTSSTRTVDLTGGTWPSYAADGRILIADISYDIESRDSGSELTLSAHGAPGADIASGTSYTLYFADYDLDDNVLQVGGLTDLEGESQPIKVRPSEWSQYQTQLRTFRPTHWTVMNSPNTTGTQAIRLYPAPDEARQYEYIAKIRPKTLRYERVAGGSIATSGAAVTGTNTAFTSGMVGSVIRISSDTSTPGNRFADNPAAFERVITGYTSATAITLESSVDTLSGVGYVISDPVDVNENGMDQAALTLAEMKFLERAGTRFSVYQDAQSYRSQLDVLKMAFLEQVAVARSSDSAYHEPIHSLEMDYGYEPDAMANDVNQ